MKTIYIVEDNEAILDGITSYLQLSGFVVKSFLNLKAAGAVLRTTRPDLLLLDIMLPDGDGFAFAGQLKKDISKTFPIVFLTARDSESDKILGFELGADDYIVKPFSPKELVMRIRAILRRVETHQIGVNTSFCWIIDDNTLLCDQKRHALSINGNPVHLTAAEWKIFTYLLNNHEIVITREQILEHCLDYAFDISDRIIDTHIKNIRSKLGSALWIKTVRGYGYVFSAGKSDGGE